jgi:hypothetical protein
LNMHRLSYLHSSGEFVKINNTVSVFVKGCKDACCVFLSYLEAVVNKGPAEII